MRENAGGNIFLLQEIVLFYFSLGGKVFGERDGTGEAVAGWWQIFHFFCGGGDMVLGKAGATDAAALPSF